MTVPALPAQGSTAWYAHYAALDTEARAVAGKAAADAVVLLTGAQTIAGAKDFTTAPTVNGAAIGGASNAVLLTGAQTVAGVKTFSSSPVVPAPTATGQAASKGYVDGLTNIFDPVLTTYNVTAANMKYTRGALAAVRAGTRDFRMAALGDSITNAQNVTLPSVNNYCARAAATLAARLGLKARRGLIPPYAWGNAAAVDPQWTLGAGWANAFDSYGSSLKSVSAPSTDTSILTFTPVDEAGTSILTDSFIIYSYAGQGNFQYSIDGGTYTTVAVTAQPSGSPTWNAYTVSAGTRGAHVLNIKAATGGGGTTYIAGAEAVDSLNRGIRYIAGGISSSVTPGGMPLSISQNGMACAFAPDLFMPAWWVNDASTGTALATFRASVEAVMAFGESLTVKKADVLWVTPAWNSGTAQATAQSYIDTIDAAAVTVGVGAIHPTAGMVSHALGSGHPLRYYGPAGTIDSVHIDNVGHNMVGAVLAGLLGSY